MAFDAAHLPGLIYFMLPAYLANMSPPFLRFWRGWNPPVDHRRFGAHKTVLGIAVAIAVAVATTAMQAWLDLPYGPRVGVHWLPAGLAFGIGVAGGDLLKSYAKRRRQIAPGKPWVPFDQLDFVVGALVLVGPYAGLGPLDVALVLLVSFLADLAVNRLSYRLGIKRTPW